MLLLIDAGNTRIKWALQKTGQPIGDWFAAGSVTHADMGTLAEQWHAYAIDRCLISNVAGEAIAAQLVQLVGSLSLPDSALQWFASSLLRAGIRNGYRQPQQLGCDRFAALIAAHYLYPRQSLLVVTCGTATTIDALDEQGNFIGGMILPGLATMARSLAVNTAGLPAVTEVKFADSFADNTQEAIISGCINAQVGAICRALENRNGKAELCILSGGAARFIAPHLPMPCEQIDNLVLIGLAASALEPAAT
jgi:type III pantothenate kinase